PQEILYPTSARTAAYLHSAAYRALADDCEAAFAGRLRIDWASARELWQYSLDPDTRAAAPAPPPARSRPSPLLRTASPAVDTAPLAPA
ncbi:hypothetical protein HK405_004465, partial [Cladochytrium tenue]